MLSRAAHVLMLLVAVWLGTAAPAAAAPSRLRRLHVQPVVQSSGGGNFTASISLPQTGRVPLANQLASPLSTKPTGNVIMATAPSTNPFLLVQAPSVFHKGDHLLGPGAAWTGAADSGYNSWTEDGNARSAAPAQDDNGRQTASDYAGTGATPRPVMRVVTLTQMRYSTNRVLCVDAEAKVPSGDPDLREGMSKVRFYDEGNYLDVTARQVYYYTDDRGVPRSVEGYCITLDAAAHQAHSAMTTRPVGNARWEESLYVRGYSKNGTPWVTQLIGSPRPANSTSTASTTWREWIGFFPDTRDFAGRANITPSAGADSCTKNGDNVVWTTDNFPNYVGCTFRTIEDFLAFQEGNYTVSVTGGGTVTLTGTNAAQAWQGTFTETAFFDVWSTGADAFNPAGRTVLNGCTPGVTATIGRTTWGNFGTTHATNGNTASSTPISGRTISAQADDAAWKPGTLGLLFDCMKFDHANLSGGGFNNEGAVITNTHAWPLAEEASIHTNSYTGDDCTALGTDHDKTGTGPAATWVFDSEMGCASAQISGYVINNHFKGSWDDQYSNDMVVWGNLHDSYDNAHLLSAQNQISVTYTGSNANATVVTGTNGSGTQQISVTEGGVTQGTSPQVQQNTCGVTSNLACSVTANMLWTLQNKLCSGGTAPCPNFTFSLASGFTAGDIHTDRNLKFMNGVTVANIGTSNGTHVTNIYTQVFPHADWYQYANDPFVSNRLIKNNISKSINCTDFTAFRMDTNGYEVAFVQNVLRSACSSGGGLLGVTGIAWSKDSDHILVYANAIGDRLETRNDTGTWIPSALDIARANVLSNWAWTGSPGTQTVNPVVQDGYWYTTIPSGGVQTITGDNTGGLGHTFDSLFEAPTSWLFTPSTTGDLSDQAHWVVPPAAIDLYGQTRASSGPKGPAEPRVTSATYTDAQWDGVAFTTTQAAHSATGTAQFCWHTGAGETGAISCVNVTATVP